MNFGALNCRRSSDAVVHLFLSISVVTRSPHVLHTPPMVCLRQENNKVSVYLKE